ncbi:unnamed protein product [Brachionus calyciflorus]|uniref:Reverse transcriptase/retrotransposon-derived protein RNase H-like domain-containing protein n=1 Tax=Brachionus calyciflorus TaxID=104777 RepID=A0A813RFL0_9BILA|nr:unnamed protein product [Brachionus calyciflorus]
MKPVKQRPYRLPQIAQEEVQRQVDTMLEKNIIAESRSPWCSPIVFAKKKTQKVNAPVLAYPDSSEEFHIIADASNVGIGAVLCQVVDGEYRPIAFAKKKEKKKRLAAPLLPPGKVGPYGPDHVYTCLENSRENVTVAEWVMSFGSSMIRFGLQRRIFVERDDVGELLSERGSQLCLGLWKILDTAVRASIRSRD